MTKKIRISLFIFVLAEFFFPVAKATHLRAGEITVDRVSCSGFTFRIRLTVYTNLRSPIRFGQGELDFGDGSDVIETPREDNEPTIYPRVGKVDFYTTHTYPGPGRYVITYFEHNRNEGILNIYNSVDTPFTLETVINIDPLLGCDNSPRLSVPPVDKGCSGKAWSHNPGAHDIDGDSLSFELVVPKQDRGEQVVGYTEPNAQKFYTQIGVPYNRANEAGTGPPTFSINSTTGTLLWDAPGNPGEYNIAFQITEWRKIGDVWVELGHVVRDMQIIIAESCRNNRPEILVPSDLCVEAGTAINEKIYGTDPDNNDVKLEAFSEVFDLDNSPAQFTPSPPVFQPARNAVGNFTWQTNCSHVKKQPDQVVFKVSDKNENGTPLVKFETWNIQIVAPAPENLSVTLSDRKEAQLTWSSYACSNASSIQVWRRVKTFPYTPAECVTGMPDQLGYTRIGTTDVQATSFTDSNQGVGLHDGAQYCYRIVAEFPQPKGGESYVSAEACLPPIEAKSPILTHVTVKQTDTEEGEISVLWEAPADIDLTQFPKPHTYKVFRGQGLSKSTEIIPTFPGERDQTTWTDQGLNTAESVYNYRIVGYASNRSKMDTSAVASQVNLTLQSRNASMKLTWEANTPWSNHLHDHPRHLIYRGVEGQPILLIDSVNVIEKGFTYTDNGQHNKTPLDNTVKYCYKVATRGGYGNPNLTDEVLINHSQIKCAYANDDGIKSECTPQLSITEIEADHCQDYVANSPCNPSSYANTIKWKKPDPTSCGEEINRYYVYRSRYKNGSYERLPDVATDTFYIDKNLSSYASCYKISAVDASGNESPLSESFCFDNCPNYELPNVFTPNGDNCNDRLRAYGDRVFVDEQGNTPCGQLDRSQRRLKCARHVIKVEFTVMNRWGKTVYTYESGGDRSIYINWDGNDNDNRELPSGVYYYTAHVTFDVVDINNQQKIIKGWVRIIR